MYSILKHLKHSSKQLEGLNLCFNDREMERKFAHSKYSHQKIILILMLYFGILVGFFGWLLNPFGKHSYDGSFLAFIIVLVFTTVFIFFS